jgi:hypothetical protein
VRGSREWGERLEPEGLCLVVVFYHPGLLAFEIEDSIIGLGIGLSHPFDDSLRMSFGGVFACKGSFKVCHLGLQHLLLLCKISCAWWLDLQAR